MASCIGVAAQNCMYGRIVWISWITSRGPRTQPTFQDGGEGGGGAGGGGGGDGGERKKMGERGAPREFMAGVRWQLV